MLALSFLLTAFASASEPGAWKVQTRIIMAVPVTVSLRESEARHFEPVFGVFREVDGELSSFTEDSEIGRLNRDKSARVSSRTRMALERALEISRKTDGLFDPTIGSLTFKKGGLKSVDFRKIKLEDPVRIPSDAFLDLGGIGKGFAVDMAASYLKERNVDRAILAASGDIRCLGDCAFAIQHPFQEEGEILKARALNGLSISTSGGYLRKHLIEPKTGKPARTFLSVTLASTAADNTTLDGLATAIAVASKTQAMQILERFPGVEFLLVTETREIFVSQGFWKLASEPVWSDDKADFKITTVNEKKKN